MNFKDIIRHKKEFWDLSPTLRLILCDLECWGKTRGEDITITELIRTDSEQQELFETGKSARISVHQFGRGADVRLFKNNNLNLLVEGYLNEKYPYGKGTIKTALIHDVGAGNHLHLQVIE